MKGSRTKKETDTELFALFVQSGFQKVKMRLGLDETVHQSEFRKLVQRVDLLEKQPR